MSSAKIEMVDKNHNVIAVRVQGAASDRAIAQSSGVTKEKLIEKRKALTAAVVEKYRLRGFILLSETSSEKCAKLREKLKQSIARDIRNGKKDNDESGSKPEECLRKLPKR